MNTLVMGGIIVAALVFALAAAGLLMNRPPLGDPPGVLARLGVYLTRNVAETGPDAVLPELGPVYLDGEPRGLLSGIADACRSLGWEDVTVDETARRVTGTVRTRMLRFSDDVVVTLLPAGSGFEARVRSISRLGRGDLGANARHVMDLRARLEADGLTRPGLRR